MRNQLSLRPDQQSSTIQQPQPGSYGQQNPFSGGYSSYGYGYQQRQYTTYDTSQDSNEFRAAWHFIQNAEFGEALELLGRMGARERNARWYYLSGLANSGLGNKILALQHLQQAVRMDPGNLEYRQALYRIQTGSQFYQDNGGADFCTVGKPNLCFSLCFFSALCNCCCRPWGGYGGYI